MVGRDGWPSVEDRQRLPYIRAIIKEVLYSLKLGHSLSRSEARLFSGGARPRTVLDTTGALFDRRLCIQRDVHPEGYSTRS